MLDRRAQPEATLPATAGALLHLGTFLVPIDVAAIGIHAGLDWSTLLLAEGLVATATFGWAAITERSVVLRSAFAVSVVALAGGIGATTPLPAPLVLAAFAGTALAWRFDGLATGWAALAGVAPLLTFVDRVTFTGAGTFERLGLTGEQPRLAAVLTGVIAAVVLAIAGRRRSDAGLVLLGVAVGAVGAIASWTGQEVEPTDSIVGLATVFLVVQLVAYAARQDDFWSIPTGIVAHITEWFAGVATVAAIFPILLAPTTDTTSTETALATLVLGAGWLAADRRRASRGLVLAAVAIAICVASAVASATASDACPRRHADSHRGSRRPQRASGRLDGGGLRRLVGPRRRDRLHQHPRGGRRGRHPDPRRGRRAAVERPRS